MNDLQDDARLAWLGTLERPAHSPEGQAELLRLLDEAPVYLVLQACGAEELRNQTTFLTAANLLARLFRRLYIDVPAGLAAHSGLPFASGPLADSVISLCHQIHRDVRVEVASVPIGMVAEGPVLVIGKEPLDPPGAIYCEGSGWSAYVGRSPANLGRSEPENVVGALVAAALGAAEVFKAVFVSLVPCELAKATTLSALTFGPDAPCPPASRAAWAAPDSVLVGAGSIGCAFLWALAHFPMLEGSLDVVDDDRVEPHNPDRAILFFPADSGEAKAKVCVERIQHYVPNLRIRSQRNRITDFIAQLSSDYRIPIMLSAVDNIAARRDIQDSLPRVILNAATGPTRVEVSRHGFNDGHACLYCLYLPQVLGKSRKHILQEQTGLSAQAVVNLHMQPGRKLSSSEVRIIERHRGAPDGAYSGWVGRGLEEFMHDAAYSQAPLDVSGGRFLVTTAFVSALAGFLLFAEWMKQIQYSLAPWRLSRLYVQDLLRLPNQYIEPTVQDETYYCLCRDDFRQQLYAEKWGMPMSKFERHA